MAYRTVLDKIWRCMFHRQIEMIAEHEHTRDNTEFYIGNKAHGNFSFSIDVQSNCVGRFVQFAISHNAKMHRDSKLANGFAFMSRISRVHCINGARVCFHKTDSTLETSRIRDEERQIFTLKPENHGLPLNTYLNGMNTVDVCKQKVI